MSDSNACTTCATCGTPFPLSDEGALRESQQKRIDELEAQVRLLSGKAATAADKLADYEDELRRLKSDEPPNGTGLTTAAAFASSFEPNRPATSPSPEPNPVAPRPATTQSRFAALLGTRRVSTHSVTPTPEQSPTRPSSVRETELQEALAHELEARQQAETKVNEMSGEIEELSVVLFQQANEMVASERKARAKLEERVEVLEKRDVEKRKRLERLEGAIKRIERVHGLLKS